MNDIIITILLIIIYIIGFILTFFILAKEINPHEGDEIGSISYIGASLIWPLVLFIYGIGELEKFSTNIAKEIHGEDEYNNSICDNGFFNNHK